MLNFDKLEKRIKEKGWSKVYFASLFEKNKGWISDMKRGIGLPDENLLQEIADRLDTTADYLTDKTEQKNKPITKGDELSKSMEEILSIIESLPVDLQRKALDQLRIFADVAKTRDKK